MWSRAQCLSAGFAWSPGDALADMALTPVLPQAEAGTDTVGLGCAWPLQLIQGIANFRADSGSVAL